MTLSLSNKSFRNILLTIIIVIGIALSILVSVLSYYSDEKLIWREFNEEVENRYSAVKREIDNNLDVLVSLQALNYSSEVTERSKFQNFSSYLLKKHVNIQALEWIPRVPDSRREAYESAARREGFPDFRFTERIAQGKMKRAEKRKEYFPVYFVEPYKGNEIALGFDLASNPERMQALDVARKTGEMFATARIALVQETKSQFGFIVFAPVYRKGALLNSDQARRDNIEGFAVGVFRINNLIEKAMNYLKPAGIDFIIYDASASGKKQLLYAHQARTRKTPLLNKEQSETRLRITKTLEVAGQKWMIIYSAAPELIAVSNGSHYWVFLLAGLAVTGLVAGFMFTITRHAAHVEGISKKLSDTNINLAQENIVRKQAEKALQEREAFLSSIIENQPGFVWLKDIESRFLAVNHAFAAACQRQTPGDVEGKTDLDVWPRELAVKYRADDAKVIQNNRPVMVEEIVYDKGEAKWFETFKTPVRDVSGKIIGTTGYSRDITERKQAQQIIESLKRKYMVILDSAGEGIFGVDLEDRMTFINPAAANMFGMRPEDMIGKLQHSLFHHTKPDGTPYPREDCPVYAVLKDRTAHRIKNEVFWKKDGTSFPVEYSGTPVFEEGKLTGAVVVFRDVTEQKHAEKTIKRNLQTQNVLNSLLRISLEGIPLKELLVKALDIILSVPFLPLIPKGGIFVVEDEPEVLILIANLGFSVPIQEICARVPFGRCLCGLAAASRQIEFAYGIDDRHDNRYDGITDHGHYNVPIQFMGKVLGVFVLYLEEGHQQEESELEFLHAVANTLAGIIERKQLENALEKFNEELTKKVKERTSELQKANTELKKLFNAIEQSEESIVITDVNGTIQYVNPAFTRKTGYSREEGIGKTPRILQSGLTPIELYNELWKTILSGNPWKGTFINKKKSGEIYYEDATIAPVFDEHGKITHFVAAKTDVTDRIMAEEELKRKNTELELAKEIAESANRAKSDFLANMSHELRTPLNSIIGFSEILKDGIAGPIADNQKDLLNDISTSGKHLLSLINDILDLSKIETGKMELELTEFNIEELIDGSLVMFKEKAINHNIKIAAEIEAGIGNIIADERKIKQVLFNLLSNAFKFTPDGGIVRIVARKIGRSEVRKDEASGTSVLPRFRTDRDFVEISVTDTGIGISPEDQKILFQPFRQIDSALSRKYSGTGLGLNLCKQLIGLHGGMIWVESDFEKGSRFVFVIPEKQTRRDK